MIDRYSRDTGREFGRVPDGVRERAERERDRWSKDRDHERAERRASRRKHDRERSDGSERF